MTRPIQGSAALRIPGRSRQFREMVGEVSAGLRGSRAAFVRAGLLVVIPRQSARAIHLGTGGRESCLRLNLRSTSISAMRAS